MTLLDADGAPQVKRHRYWVEFKIVLANNMEARGQMGVERDLPICNANDLQGVAAAIANQLMTQNEYPPGATALSVVSWTKFEDETIILARDRH